MKTNLLFLVVLLILLSCKKEEHVKVTSISYESSFSTQPNPFAIAIEKNQGFVFVANHNASINNYSSKIQKFKPNGEPIQTIIDFETFTSGKYQRYTPIDLCTGNNALWALTIPMSPINENWHSYTGFSVLQFNLNGAFSREYDFTVLGDYWHQSSMSFQNNSIYVINGTIIKKIDQNSGISTDIHISYTNNLPLLHVSDMIIESEEAIYLTGQGTLSDDFPDASICHITKIDIKYQRQFSYYSTARTGATFAMMNNPGFAINSSGYLFLATFYGMSIEIYDNEKNLILMQEIKTLDGKETLPTDVALFKNSIYVADYKNDQIHLYREN